MPPVLSAIEKKKMLSQDAVLRTVDTGLYSDMKIDREMRLVYRKRGPSLAAIAHTSRDYSEILQLVSVN